MRLPSIKLPSPGRVYIPKPHGPRISAKLRWRFTNKGHRIADFMQRWQRTFLFRSGASLRAYAVNIMKHRKDKSVHASPGAPPFRHLAKGDFAKPAIQFAVDMPTGLRPGKASVFVGVIRSFAGYWGWKHEQGGWFRRGPDNTKGYFPPRPFMKPAFRRWQKYGLPAILKSTGDRAHGLR